MRVLSMNGSQGFQKVLLAGVLSWTLACSVAAGQAQQAADAKQSTASDTTVLPWIADVVKMSEAGVPPVVIQTFVKNSTARSTLTSDDVIYLQGKGINTDIIGTMIEHGAAPAPAAQVAAAPARPPVQQPATPVYPPPADFQTPYQYQYPTDYAPASSVSVSYIPYSNPSYYSYYPYYYPYYYTSYPYYYYSYPYCGYNYYRGSSCFVGSGSSFCRFPFTSSTFCNPSVAPVGTGGGVRTPVTRGGGSGSVVRTGGNTPVMRGGGGSSMANASFSGGVTRGGGGGGSMRVASGGFSGGMSGGGGGGRSGGGRR